MHVPILTYHAIDERPSPISIPPAAFEWQMSELRNSGFHVIPLGRLVQHYHTGSTLPDRPVVVTFDDGLESVYTFALPVLRRFGFQATVFLVAGYCGKQNDWPSQPSNALRLPLMTWSQIRELDRDGIEFGAHTDSHPRLDRVPFEELEWEILGSKTNIEQRLGHAVELFAYPYGRRSEASDALVRQGYSGACTTKLALAGSTSDPFELERVDAYYLQHPLMVRHLSSRFFSPYLSLRRRLRAVASAVLRREWQ